jgi:hypothetical protein
MYEMRYEIEQQFVKVPRHEWERHSIEARAQRMRPMQRIIRNLVNALTTLLTITSRRHARSEPKTKQRIERSEWNPARQPRQ